MGNEVGNYLGNFVASSLCLISGSMSKTVDKSNSYAK